MARPDSARKNHVRRETVANDQSDRVNEAISQVKRRITVVRIAVAKLESTPVTPIFAKGSRGASKDRGEQRPGEPVIHFVQELPIQIPTRNTNTPPTIT